MVYPISDDIKKAIIAVLNASGGQASVETIIKEVTAKFPQLTPGDLSRKDPSGPLSWPHRIHTVRVSMVRLDKTLDENAPRGIWRLKSIPPLPAPSISLLPTPPILTSQLQPPSLPQQANNLEELLRKHIHDIRGNIMNKLLILHPSGFEKLSGKLLESQGFNNIQIIGRTGDGGIDGNGNLQLGIVTIKAAFQVKRWQNNVGRPILDQFRGAIQGTHDQGIIITTSDFTDEAKQASSRPGTVPIVLINGQKVIDIMIEKNIGIKCQPLNITQIDDEFLDSL